jgi:hypothetical protein
VETGFKKHYSDDQDFNPFFQSEETCTALDFNRMNSGTFKTRRRNKEALMRDLDLSKLKCRFLEII